MRAVWGTFCGCGVSDDMGAVHLDLDASANQVA